MAGFFTGVRVNPLPTGGELIFEREGHDLNHPRTGVAVPTRALGATGNCLRAAARLPRATSSLGDSAGTTPISPLAAMIVLSN